jgi:hypothetical protein
MSRDVLDGKKVHTYLDDLESFYFVLSWILMVYTGPRTTRSKFPSEAAYWDEPDSARLKGGYFGIQGFKASVDPWFGPCLHELVKRLFDFFRFRPFDDEEDALPLNPKKDYDTYLSHIQQCILDMEAEDMAAEHHLSDLSNEPVRS